MASIRREIVIDAPPHSVWDALRDWGALHERLAPGFVTDCQVDGTDRVATFFNGSIVRERIVSCEDVDRRLVWSIVDGPYTHHNGAAQVLPAEGGRTRFVWTTDLLPDAAADRTAQLMDHGIEIIQATLSGQDSVTAAG
jgi:Polyketide cyclase / dehydrase and lipid transport